MNGTPGGSSTPDIHRLEFAMDVGNLAWWEMNCETGAVRFHRRKTDMLGYEPEPFTHYTDFTTLLHPDDLGSVMQAMREHLAGTRSEYRAEYRIRAKTGDYRWFEDVGRVSSRDDAGHPLAVTGIVTDITDRRMAEEALSASEERFRRMFHGHSAVKLMIDPATGEIVDANQSAANFYGWPVGDLKRMRIQQINDQPPDIVNDRLTSAAAAPSSCFEFRHRRADGSIRDVEVYSSRIEIVGRIYLYSIIHDISDRKRAERALKVSDQRFRMLAENIADALWVLDDETERYQYISPSVVRLGGYSAEEVMSRSVKESLTAESYAALRRVREERIQEFERGLERTYVDIVEQTHRDGSPIIIEVHGRFVRNAETGRIEAIGVSRNITERVMVEQALRAAHDRLRHAEDFARFGHWEFSIDDRIMRASDGAIRVYGFENAAIPLQVIQGCVLPEYRPVLDRALQGLIEQGVPYDQEFKIRRVSDGEIVHVHSKAEYDAKTRKVFGVVQDITERKQVEEERERLIEELKHAIEQVKTLKGIVPICASCKKIRDDRGYWEQVEAYVARHTDAQFSHGICPDCAKNLFSEFISGRG
jgi:PAS domain S-box-containing protein